MQVVQAPRASAILYQLLVIRADRRPWLLPANICPVVPLTFYKSLIPFKFVDISPQTLHMDLGLAEGLLATGAYGGVLYAHTYGDPSTPQDFFRRMKTRFPEVFILDDRCLCAPQVDPATETYADGCLFSTGYAKIVDLGGGGYAFFNQELNFASLPALPYDPADYQEIERACRRAVSERRRFEYRDTDWLETGRAGLPSWYDYARRIEQGLAESLQVRARINAVYQARLPRHVQFPASFQTWRFNIRVEGSRHILDALFDAGLFASSHYASLAGIMTEDSAPNAERLASEVLNLFNDHHFSTAQAERACKIVLENLN